MKHGSSPWIATHGLLMEIECFLNRENFNTSVSLRNRSNESDGGQRPKNLREPYPQTMGVRQSESAEESQAPLMLHPAT